LQLLLKVPVTQENGAKRTISVLVDTGAEANLIRKGFLDDSLLKNTAEPLSFVTASGQPLDGGKRTGKLTLHFQPEVDGQRLSENRHFPAEFYEAEISVDAIVGHPWMAHHKIGVFPHHQALALEEPQFTHLFGAENRGSSRKNKGRNRRVRNAQGRWMTRAMHVAIENGELDDLILLVEKMQLELPREGLEDPASLSDEEMRIIAEKLLKVQLESPSINLIEVHQNEENSDPWIPEMVQRIHEEFDGTVFSKEALPDPPCRGLYGFAHIQLKEGAEPQKQNPFQQHNERCEAMKKITEDWLSKKFIERPTQPVEWLSQSFAVPKKSATFPWRGVVDMGG
jgi:hypothetical protein